MFIPASVLLLELPPVVPNGRKDGYVMTGFVPWKKQEFASQEMPCVFS